MRTLLGVDLFTKSTPVSYMSPTAFSTATLSNYRTLFSHRQALAVLIRLISLGPVKLCASVLWVSDCAEMTPEQRGHW
jgi:hypothetical protein